MNPENFEAACSLVPRTYVEGGQNARRNHEKHFRVLLQQVRGFQKGILKVGNGRAGISEVTFSANRTVLHLSEQEGHKSTPGSISTSGLIQAVPLYI